MTATVSPAPAGLGRLRRIPRSAWGRLFSLKVLLPALLLAALLAAGWRFVVPHGPGQYAVPQSAQFEASYGIRINQVDIVGDGGLVELGYTVLDPEKAGQFQSDTKNPPKLHSEARDGVVSISALMKQGHNLRPGQTYFVIYENPKNTIRPGESIAIEYKGSWLRDVPVR